MSKHNQNIQPEYKDEKPLGAIPQRERKPKSKAARAAKDVITGDILHHNRLRRWYPLGIYCIALVFIYIAHNFNFQRLQRTEIQQRMDLSNERSRSVVFSSIRMNASRHSHIMEEIERRGIKLEESKVPPKTVKEN